jgi:UDP-N-acetylglucosamine 4,6-dehydratase
MTEANRETTNGARQDDLRSPTSSEEFTRVATIEGATVAITGGTGSFGSTMAGHLLARGVNAVHILSRDEAKQDEMRRRFSDARLKFFLGDVRDYDSVAGAFIGTDFIFHAAALKQVPSCEFFPQQAVKTNFVGSHNVIEAAASAGVRSLVCLSTDKAVYPVNVMGMSKALMEKTAQAFARSHPTSKTTVSIIRYGNVMYSRGSVIPLFVKQIQSGQPLTLTEPKMTRFLMSLQESVDLVEYAFTHAEPGDLFVRKAPASTVEVLARAVASLLEVEDPELKLIGTRHGEKLHETLLSREEMVKAADKGKYFRVPLDARSLQYELYYEEGKANVPAYEDYTSENTERMDVQQTKTLLLKLPEIHKLLGVKLSHDAGQPLLHARGAVGTESLAERAGETI